MGEIARTNTPLENEWEASVYLVMAYEGLTGQPFNKNLMELMLAQIWIETGQGKSLMNYNPGNLSGSYNGDYWRPPWYEVTEDSKERYKKLHELMLQNKVPNKFQAYPDFTTGFEQYIQQIYMKDRFKPLLEAGMSGDAFEFASAIFYTGYCPDDPGCRPENTYKTIETFQKKFREEGVFSFNGGDIASSNGSFLLVAAPALLGLALVLAASKKNG